MSFSQSKITTVFVIRHAEKMSGNDPSLTETGKQRALQVDHLLKDAGITAIYSTQFKRTMETAEPLAKRLNLKIEPYNPRDNQSLVERVMNDHPGETILVVGHSNTVNKLSEAFGADDFGELDESVYDYLYQLSIQFSNGKAIAKRVTLNTVNQKL
ncbi:MAG: histidine phosphatase family protein [Calditrichaeota bacterium]|nr:histidine phosphatase family protein [Calditrichota bacterium]